MIPGHVESLNKLNPISLPHLGWNSTNILNFDILPSFSSNHYFYFIHSYYFETDLQYVVASTPLTDSVSFPSLVASGSILGCQFHPEKSHHHGLSFQILS